MNKVLDTYLNSIWLPGVVMITSLALVFVFYGFFDVRLSNVFVLKVVSLVNNIVLAASLPMMITAGVYRMLHGNKLSGVIYVVVGVSLIVLLIRIAYIV